jgi:hypothetical protein
VNVARSGDRRGAYAVLVRKPERIKALERPKRIWEMTLKRIFKKSVGKLLIGFIFLRIGISGGPL